MTFLDTVEKILRLVVKEIRGYMDKNRGAAQAVLDFQTYSIFGLYNIWEEIFVSLWG